MPSTAINIRLPNEALARIDRESDNRSEYCRRSVEQIWDLLQVADVQHPIQLRTALEYLAELERDGLRIARAALSPDECALIVGALNGTFLEPSSFRYLDREVRDGGAAALAEKLEKLPAHAFYALVRAVERFRASEPRPEPRALLEGK